MIMIQINRHLKWGFRVNIDKKLIPWTICIITVFASVSDIWFLFCCLRYKSRSFPSQYSITVQNLEKNIKTAMNNYLVFRMCHLRVYVDIKYIVESNNFRMFYRFLNLCLSASMPENFIYLIFRRCTPLYVSGTHFW